MAYKYQLCPLSNPMHIIALCSAFIDECDINFNFEGESHDFYEAVFILKGKAGITAGSDILCLEAGQMIFHPPLEFHRIWNAGSGPLRFLILSFALENAPFFAHCVRQFSTEEGTALERMLGTLRAQCIMENEFVRGIGQDTWGLHTVINQLECFFMSLVQREPPEKSLKDKSERARGFSEAVAFLQANMHNRLSVVSIADYCHMSRSSLQNMFMHYAGVGVITYYHRMKAIRAAELLRTGCSIKETATRMGFSDPNYFSRFFSAALGTPPSRYIKEHR